MTLFCDGRVILLAVPTSLRINTLERQPGLLGTSIGETTRTYASSVGLGKGVSFSCMKWNRSLKLSTRNFRKDLPRIWLEWAHTMTRSRVLGGQFHIIIMLYRRTELVQLTLLDFWGNVPASCEFFAMSKFRIIKIHTWYRDWGKQTN